MAYEMDTKIPWHRTEAELYETLDKWHAKNGEINCSGNPIRFDKQKNKVGRDDVPWTPSTRAVTVEFEHHTGKKMSFTVNDHARPADNLRVIAICLEEMRMIERRGLNEVMSSAFLQLAAPSAPTTTPGYPMLGLKAGATLAEIDKAFKAKAKDYHPDHGSPREVWDAFVAERDRAEASAER